MDTATVKTYLIKNRIGLAIALLGAYLLFPVFFEIPILPMPNDPVAIWNSLDPSWIMAMNYANIRNMTWGTDFTFTYGPLAYLATRTGWGVSKYSFLLFDLFVFYNFVSIFFLHYKRSQNKIFTVMLTAAVCVILPLWIGPGYAFVLLAFLTFWIRESIENRRILNSILQIVLVVLLFYIKFNTGLVALVFFTAGIFYRLAFTNENKLALLCYSVATVALIGLMAIVLNVALNDYILSGFEMISGYNEIMYMDTGLANHQYFAWAALGLAVALFGWRMQWQRDRIIKNLFVFFLFASMLFILYKQAFIRADLGHVLEFFNYFLLIIFCFGDLHLIRKVKYSNIISLVLIAIGIYIVADHNRGAIKIWNKLSKERYVTQLVDFSETSGNRLSESEGKFPQAISGKIGSNTIDTFPWDVASLLENGANYQPRPICQSYVAYTAKLQQLNFEHYNSERAPRFVLYDYASIDYRYPMFDESLMNLTLLQNYKYVDSFMHKGRPTLLLEQAAKSLKLQKIREYKIRLNQKIVPKPGVYYKVYCDYSFKGKIISVADHAPEISLVIVTGQTRSKYRTSKSLLEAGIFGNRHIVTTGQFKNYITNAAIESENVISGYYFEPADPSYFDDEVRVEEYKIN